MTRDRKKRKARKLRQYYGEELAKKVDEERKKKKGSEVLRFDEKAAYCLAIAGTAGDHISTRIGQPQSHLYESNRTVVALMQRGLWLPVDLILLAIIIACPYWIMRTEYDRRWIALLVPSLIGVIRLLITISNLQLILS